MAGGCRGNDVHEGAGRVTPGGREARGHAATGQTRHVVAAVVAAAAGGGRGSASAGTGRRPVTAPLALPVLGLVLTHGPVALLRLVRHGPVGRSHLVGAPR